MSLARVVGLVVLTTLLAALLRVLILVIAARIRVTDWLGYVATVGAVILVSAYLLDVFAIWGWAGITVGLAAAWSWSVKSISGFRASPQRKLLGAFLVGPVPHGVTNWVTWRDRAR